MVLKKLFEIFIEKRTTCQINENKLEGHLANQDAFNGLYFTSSYAVCAGKRSQRVMHRRDTKKPCIKKEKRRKITLKKTLQLVLQHREFSSKDGIFGRKKSYSTWVSLKQSPKVVPDSYYTLANTVRANLTTITRNVIIRRDVTVEKRLVK
jgi:hypothetical protein